MSDREAMEMARDLVRGSIIEDATARFISQVLREAHDSKIKPLRDKLRIAIEGLEEIRDVALGAEGIGFYAVLAEKTLQMIERDE